VSAAGHPTFPLSILTVIGFLDEEQSSIYGLADSSPFTATKIAPAMARQAASLMVDAHGHEPRVLSFMNLSVEPAYKVSGPVNQSG
jgi:hypothetical protein